MHANLIAPIPGSEGYLATRGGKILSTRFGKVKALKDAPHPKGYRSVALWKDKKQKTFWVHKLVLMAFDRDRLPGEVCLHENDNPADNRLSNIKWGTPKENTEQMIRRGRENFRGLRR